MMDDGDDAGLARQNDFSKTSVYSWDWLHNQLH